MDDLHHLRCHHPDLLLPDHQTAEKARQGSQGHDAIKKGDKVVTIGGIRGTVAVVKDSTVVLKVDDNTRIEFSKSAISQVLNKKEEPAAEKPAKKAKGEKPAVEAPKAEEAKEDKAEEPKAEEAAPAEEKA